MTATTFEFKAIGRVLSDSHPVTRGGLSGLEARIGPNEVRLVQTGIGPRRARAVTQKLLEDQSYDMVISTGFAGALNDAPVGSLIIGQEVVFEESVHELAGTDGRRFTCHLDWITRAENLHLLGSLTPLPHGRVVSVNRVLIRASQKRLLAQQTGAIAVDMESGAIGQVAHEYGLPFLVIRTISDGVQDDLPVDFNLFLTPHGWIRGARQVLFNPHSWTGLYRLYRNSTQAGLQLSHFFYRFLRATSHDALTVV